MIEIPKKYKNEIISRYGSLGMDWLNKIDNLIYKYQNKLKLTNIELVNNLGINIVLKADSEIYGEVFVKFSTPGSSAINEINFITNCNSKYIVRCFYYDLDDRIMVLESIKPGTTLTSVETRSERIRIFTDIVNDLIIDYDNEDNKYGNYHLKTEVVNLDSYQDLNLDMARKIDIAKRLYGDIEKSNLKKYILHRDLHHKNILKSENGFKVIDPHGLSGYKVFELTQFIKAELELENNNLDKLHEITEEVAETIKEDIGLTYKALYVDNVNKLIFYMQSGADKQIVKFNSLLCEKIEKELGI